jgi:hypothetical protein
MFGASFFSNSPLASRAGTAGFTQSFDQVSQLVN